MRHSSTTTAMSRKWLVSYAAALAVALGAMAAAGTAPARASVLGSGISCTGWTHGTFTPGLTNNPQPISMVLDVDLNVIDAYSPTGSCLATGSAATEGRRVPRR